MLVLNLRSKLIVEVSQLMALQADELVDLRKWRCRSWCFACRGHQSRAKIVEVCKLMLCEAERRAGGGNENRAGRLVREEVAAVVEVRMAGAVRGGRAKGGR